MQTTIETPLTDRLHAAHQNEFVWDTDGCTEIHRHIIKPISARLGQIKAHKVLDLGCGNGAFTARLGALGFDMLGIDHSESGVDIASQHHPHISFRQQDLTYPLTPEFHHCFDAVVSVEVLEHLLLPRKLIENALLALKPGGLLIVTTPYHGYLKNLALALTNKYDDHWHPLRDYGHIKFFSKKTLSELFEEYGLRQLQYETVGRLPAFARSMILSGKAKQ